MKNTGYTIVAKSPLLRPGLEITMGPVSEKYLVEETRKLLDYVRQINSSGIDITAGCSDHVVHGNVTIAGRTVVDKEGNLHIPASV